MFNLRLATYLLTGPSLAGVFVIAALIANMIDGRSIIIASVLGAILGLPIAWVIASKIADVTRKPDAKT